MKISNNGLLGAAWFILAIAYMATIINHLVRQAFVGGEFAVPSCLHNRQILRRLPAVGHHANKNRTSQRR